MLNPGRDEIIVPRPAIPMLEQESASDSLRCQSKSVHRPGGPTAGPTRPSRVGPFTDDPTAGQASRAPAVTSRLPRIAAGSSRVSADMIARPPRSGLGRGDLASEHHYVRTQDHNLRVLGQPAAEQDQPAEHQIIIKYSRRTDTNLDRAPTRLTPANGSSEVLHQVLKLHRRIRNVAGSHSLYLPDFRRSMDGRTAMIR